MAREQGGGRSTAASPVKGLTVERERRAFGWGLALIIGVYLALATLYAVRTPNWQSPDEPAHYNYAGTIAAEGRLPVLQAGDYPAAYLEEIKARRFPPDLPIDTIRYESHQPPAYYVLAAGLLRLAPRADLSTRLLLLRLLSVALGACSLVILALLARRLFGSASLALSAAALAGSVPMFIAITAAANNDALAFVMLGLVALHLAGPREARWSIRASPLLGLSLGLCLLTKFQAYVALPLAGGLWLYDLLIARDLSWRQAWRSAALMGAVALVIATPWLARNMSVYGWRDPLGLARHDAIVVGQLRTAELLGEIDWPAYLWRYARTTFHSFWGQFGWMAAPLPERAYVALGLVALLGAGSLLAALSRWRRTAARARRGVFILTLWAVLTAASFLWYNLSFVQFQGRYLFPALPPLMIGLAYGLTTLARRRNLVWSVIGLTMAGLLAFGAWRGDMPYLALSLCVAARVGLLALGRLPARLQWVAPALAAVGLNALALYSLVVILPQLAP